MSTQDRYPSSDNIVAYTPSTGSDNWAMVDEAVSDDDGTYNYITDAGGIDQFGFSAFSLGTINSVTSLTLTTTARRVEATYMSIANRIKVGGNTYTGSASSLTGSYAEYSTEWLTNPKTASSWTQAEIEGTDGTNDLQFIGYAAAGMGAGETQRVTRHVARVTYEVAAGGLSIPRPLSRPFSGPFGGI